jgi:hypothetical protein
MEAIKIKHCCGATPQSDLRFSSGG